ncbi:MAG: hydantoinase B/oxoprolinase family protein, partial [Candidatus Rokubacteria bacterium]|nr:hydantoinase B/oxoprolinase family protein [Candidatus Rokubacteria bacterium]
YEELVGIREGDYFFNNDPFVGGAHSPDQTIVTPIYSGDELIGWAGGLTHVPETGASEPGGNPVSALTRYEEGIYMPCVKVAEDDRIRHDLEVMIERGTRTPVYWLLDQRARIAGCRLIRDGVKALVTEYGGHYFLPALYEYIEDTRRACITRVTQVLFPGRYRAVSFHAVPWKDKPVRYARDHELIMPIELQVSPDGEIRLDFDGTSPAGLHSFNASQPTTVGNMISMLIQNVFYDIKYNYGIQHLIEGDRWHLPHSCLNPPDPSYAVGNWATAIVSCSGITTCLSFAYYARGFREEVTAGHGLTSAMRTGGVDQYGRRFSINNFVLSCSGVPATAVRDGVDVCYAVWNPQGDCGDVELWEKMFPQIYLGRRIYPDPGFGKYRGGSGLESLYLVALVDQVEMASSMGGSRVFASPGLMGGYPASANYRRIVSGFDLSRLVAARLDIPHSEGADSLTPDWTRLGDGVTECTDAVVIAREVRRNQLWQQINGATGGYGDPLERNPVAVAADLGLGLVTPGTAEHVYGVVVNDGSVDENATGRRRAEIRARRRSRGMPAGQYVEQQRLRILAGELPEPARAALNQCLAASERFRREFVEFWGLPETFAGVEPTSA